jgi:hypothetical protein
LKELCGHIISLKRQVSTGWHAYRDYTALKTAILKRYDTAKIKTYRELAVRVKDLPSKWLKEHTSSVEAVLKQVALELDEYFLWRKQAPSENNKQV